ncbi:MAG: MFS transporter [Verrucomicrobia bacterium]|nr:MFS transporter [Verrucomicrobiota bacterium]
MPPHTSTTEFDDRSRLQIILGVLVAMLLAALDQAIVAPALPTIGRSLGGGGYLSWVVTAYLLTATAVTPLYGKLSDIFGRDRALWVSLLTFAAGSVICALAPNLWALICGRAVQGIGGGGLGALALTVIGDVVAPRERARYQGYISGVWATASFAGPILGGVIAERLNWSVIFWLNLPLVAIAFLVVSKPIKLLPRPGKRHSIDWLGAVWMVAGTVCVLLILTWGGTRYPWFSLAIGSLAMAALFFGALVLHSSRTHPEPLLPLPVLRNQVILFGTCSGALAMAAYLGLSVYLPLYFEGLLHLAPDLAGLSLVPLMGLTVVGAAWSGVTAARVKQYKRIALAGLVLAVASLGVTTLFVGRLNYWALESLLGVVGLGTGTLFPITTVSVQNAAEPRDLGVTTGVLTFLRSLGAALGVAILGTVFLACGVLGLGEQSNQAGINASPVALIHGFTWAFLLANGLLIASWICLWRMKELPWRTAQGTAETKPELAGQTP